MSPGNAFGGRTPTASMRLLECCSFLASPYGSSGCRRPIENWLFLLLPVCQLHQSICCCSNQRQGHLTLPVTPVSTMSRALRMHASTQIDRSVLPAPAPLRKPRAPRSSRTPPRRCLWSTLTRGARRYATWRTSTTGEACACGCMHVHARMQMHMHANAHGHAHACKDNCQHVLQPQVCTHTSACSYT